MASKSDSFNKSCDLLLNEASKKALMKRGADYRNEEIPEHKFSKKHNEKIRKIFKNNNKTTNFRCFILKNKMIAAILVACIISISITLPNAKALKSIFINYFFDKESPSTVIRFDDGSATSYTFDNITFSFIPPGYIKTNESSTKRSYTVNFEKNDKWFSFHKGILKASKTIDSEDGEMETIFINKNQAVYFTNKNVNTIVWNSENHSLTLVGNIEKDILVKIAENILVEE